MATCWICNQREANGKWSNMRYMVRATTCDPCREMSPYSVLVEMLDEFEWHRKVKIEPEYEDEPWLSPGMKQRHSDAATRRKVAVAGVQAGISVRAIITYLGLGRMMKLSKARQLMAPVISHPATPDQEARRGRL